MAEDKREKYLHIFQAEAAEHLKGLNEGLLSLEKDPGNAEVIHSILRSAHTLKGSARMLGLSEIGEIAHRMEDLLKAVEELQLQLTAELTDLLLEGTDAINALVNEKAAGRAGLSSQDLVARLAQALSGTPAAPSAPPEPEPAAREAATSTSAAAPKKSKKASSKPKAKAAAEPSPPARPKAETAPEEPQPPAPPPPSCEGPADFHLVEMETLRVEAQRLDSLVDLAGELLINKI